MRNGRVGSQPLHRKTNSAVLAATYESHSANRANVKSWRKLPPSNKKNNDRTHCRTIARYGVWNRGWTFERARKKIPSRDRANVMRAPLMATPFNVVMCETIMAVETTTAAAGPRNDAVTASDIGEEEIATVVGARANCTAAFTSM